MDTTVTFKRKIIDLKSDTFKSLSVMAAKKGTNLKNLIETLLDQTAREFDDAEAYSYLSKHFPDGKVMLDADERQKFMEWMNVHEEK